jgi:D-alanine-D-alanine ligase
VLAPARKFPFQGVVVIADLIALEAVAPNYLCRNLEQTDESTLDGLCASIQRLGLKVHHYEHPRFLAENAERHIMDMVLSIFGGSVSRSRMALVPAICESMGLPFVGPDAYGRIICQDKEVSKALAADAGLRVPQHRIIRSEEDLINVTDFHLPYVVKPLWEGSSIGISPDSLVTNSQKGRHVLEDLLTKFQQPLMVEAFVPGREVSYCFIEPVGYDRVRALAEIVWGGEADYFDHHLYDATHKETAKGRKVVRSITDDLRAIDEKAMERLLRFLGPTGYGRIDGKLLNGEFIFLEITPDAWLGASGTFVSSFREQGLSFDDVIALLLLSGRLVPRDQPTSD